MRSPTYFSQLSEEFPVGSPKPSKIPGAFSHIHFTTFWGIPGGFSQILKNSRCVLPPTKSGRTHREKISGSIRWVLPGRTHRELRPVGSPSIFQFGRTHREFKNILQTWENPPGMWENPPGIWENPPGISVNLGEPTGKNAKNWRKMIKW